jgi:hypothetical protein
MSLLQQTPLISAVNPLQLLWKYKWSFEQNIASLKLFFKSHMTYKLQICSICCLQRVSNLSDIGIIVYPVQMHLKIHHGGRD